METGAWNERQGDLDVESVGPFQEYRLVVNGWTVPGVSSRIVDTRTVSFVCGEYGIDVPQEQAGRYADWIAHVVATTLGWTCHPKSPDWKPAGREGEPPFKLLPWKRLIGLSMVGTDGDSPHEEKP